MVSQEELERQKAELLAKYPDEYWVVNDYGYGDGGCYGPYDAFEAVVKYAAQLGRCAIENIDKGLPWNKNVIITLLEQFERGVSAAHNDMIHSISDYDRSKDFEDFLSS